MPNAEFHPRVKASPARQFAYDICSEARIRGAYVRDMMQSRMEDVQLSKEDKAFAVKLVFGVTCTSGVLDELINSVLKNPADLQDDVRDCLRISTYELFFMNKAGHAAVNQGVELVRKVNFRASGLANFVLRRLVERQPSFPFGNPANDDNVLCRQYGFPYWLGVHLIADLGREDAEQFMRASNQRAPLYFGLNSIKITDDDKAVLATTSKPFVFPDADLPLCRVSSPEMVTDKQFLRLIKQGKVIISDAASQAIAYLSLGHHQPSRALEIGAGRGTKSLLLQSASFAKFGSQLNLTTMDIHSFKQDILGERARTYGASLENRIVADATKDSSYDKEPYDFIFIDAPCSGLGTLRRHPEIRWRITQKGIDELSQTGYSILCAASRHCSPRGTILYSTCTVTLEETTALVKNFLGSPCGKDFSLAPMAGRSCFATALSEDSPDAHFAVIFTRK